MLPASPQVPARSRFRPGQRVQPSSEFTRCGLHLLRALQNATRATIVAFDESHDHLVRVEYLNSLHRPRVATFHGCFWDPIEPTGS